MAKVLISPLPLYTPGVEFGMEKGAGLFKGGLLSTGLLFSGAVTEVLGAPKTGLEAPAAVWGSALLPLSWVTPGLGLDAGVTG